MYRSIISGFILLICLVHITLADEDCICNLASTFKEHKLKLLQEIDFRTLTVLNLNSRVSNKCTWTINAQIGRRIVDLSNIQLSSKDNFTIIEIVKPNVNVTNNLTIYDHHKRKLSVSSGLLFMDKYQDFEISVEFDDKDTTFKRTFDIIIYNDYTDIYLMKDSGTIMFPINQVPNSVLSSTDFTLKSSHQYSDRLILLTFTKKKLATNFTMDGTHYDQGKDLPDIYMGKIDGIEFKLDNFKIDVSEPILINYWLVTADCSKEIKMDEKNSIEPIIYPNDRNRANNFQSVICAQIFSNNINKYYQLLITDETSMLPNPSDFIMIYSLPEMELIQTIQSVSIPTIKNVHTFLEHEKLLILYDSPYSLSQSNNSIKPIELSLTNNMSFILDNVTTQTINVDKTDKETRFIYNFYSKLNKNLIVFLEPKSKLDDNKMKITIYDTDMIGDNIRPLVSLDRFNVLPPAISVNNYKMRIEIYGILSDLKLTIKHVDAKTENCYSVSSYNPAFKISSNDRNCTWFITNSDNNIDSKYTIISPSSLKMPQNSWIQVTKLDVKSEKTIIHGPLHESYLGDSVMSSAYNYLIEFFFNNTIKDDVNIFIMKKPYFFNDSGLININSLPDDKFSSKSINYPGYYPIGFEQSLSFKNNDNETILVTVNDIDLHDHHWLWIGNDDLNENITSNNKDIDQIPDHFTQSTFFIALNTKYSKIFGHSGRGYDIEMTKYGCGGVIDLSKTEKIKFPTNQTNFHENPRCIWQIIKYRNIKKADLKETILKFNVSMVDKDNKAIMHIYDSISLRNSTIHFALCNETRNDCLNDTNNEGHYQGSIGMAYIVYDFSDSLKMKKDYSFEMTIESTKCMNTKYNLSVCANGQRCITELMSCNGQNDCGDWSDELHCGNGPFIPPKPNGGGGGSSGGVNIFIVIFLLMPLSAILGIIGYIYLPRLLTTVRHGRYSEFRSDMSEVS